MVFVAFSQKVVVDKVPFVSASTPTATARDVFSVPSSQYNGNNGYDTLFFHCSHLHCCRTFWVLTRPVSPSCFFFLILCSFFFVASIRCMLPKFVVLVDDALVWSLPLPLCSFFVGP